jgi:hypothetical protein
MLSRHAKAGSRTESFRGVPGRFYDVGMLRKSATWCEPGFRPGSSSRQFAVDWLTSANYLRDVQGGAASNPKYLYQLSGSDNDSYPSAQFFPPLSAVTTAIGVIVTEPKLFFLRCAS